MKNRMIGFIGRLTALLTAVLLASAVSAQDAIIPAAETLAQPPAIAEEDLLLDAPQTDDRVVRLSLLCAVSGLGLCVTGRKKIR